MERVLSTPRISEIIMKRKLIRQGFTLDSATCDKCNFGRYGLGKLAVFHRLKTGVFTEMQDLHKELQPNCTGDLTIAVNTAGREYDEKHLSN